VGCCQTGSGCSGRYRAVTTTMGAKRNPRAKEHLLPKIRDEIKFDSSTVVFNDELLEYIINDFTEKEDGVRNLKRCLEIIYKKLNLYRLMKPNVNLFENSEGFKFKSKITFPCILTRQLIDDLINKASTKDIPYGMYT
jgi:ATP-dependent Lon protease